MKDIYQTLSELNADLQRDARFLLADILQKPVSSFVIETNDTVVTKAEFQAFDSGLTQLKQGKPLAYVLGNQPFWSLNFLVNEHTLIPRPDTEHLVERALKVGDGISNTVSDPLQVVDLGTGSGIIAICLKHERHDWAVTATDFSEEALKVAKKNADSNNVDIQLLQGSWFDALDMHHKYHLIVSNPPYISPDDTHLVDLNDPITALVSEHEGMADIETIISKSYKYLHQHGWLLIEHGYNQGAQVRSCFLSHGFEQVETVRDYGNNERLTMGQLVSR